MTRHWLILPWVPWETIHSKNTVMGGLTGMARGEFFLAEEHMLRLGGLLRPHGVLLFFDNSLCSWVVRRVPSHHIEEVE